MNKQVVFNTWSAAFFNPGGGEVQLMETRKHLQKQGWTVDLYDQWNPKRDAPIYHHFSIRSGSEFPMVESRNIGMKVVLSPILWVEYQKGTAPYDYVRRILSLADVLMTNSDAESKKLSQAFDVDFKKFHKTRNAVSDEYLNRDTSADFCKTFGIDRGFILSVANVDRRKNTHALVDACKQLGKKLVLVGHIRDQAYFDEFKASYEGMKFVGPVTDVALLKSAYQSCSLFALPSLFETPGIAALEAASQGARIVITQEGPTREYFGDFVTYVDPDHLKTLVAGMTQELSAARDSAQMVAHVLKNYTWDQTARDVIAGYQKLGI